jgi:hypothetical protein
MFSKAASLGLLNHIPRSYPSKNVGKTLVERGFPPKPTCAGPVTRVCSRPGSVRESGSPYILMY